MKNSKFVTDEIYHIYNRGVDKRIIFLDDQDRFHFIHDLFEFNDQRPAPPLNIAARKLHRQSLEDDLPMVGVKLDRGPREFLVEILAFCLMDNHFHLMLRQRIENGITLFMRKLGTGYANYFNRKYKRTGRLFEGIFKSVRLAQESHFIHLPYYIHLNPLDYSMPQWRNKEVESAPKAMEYLEKYRWSSHLDYMGIKNFPSVTQRDFLLSFFDGDRGYKEKFLKQLQDFSKDNLDLIMLE